MREEQEQDKLVINWIPTVPSMPNVKTIFGSLYPSIISPTKLSVVEYLSSIINEGTDSSRLIKPSGIGLSVKVRKTKKNKNHNFFICCAH